MRKTALTTLLVTLVGVAPLNGYGQTVAAPAPVLTAPIPTGEALVAQNRLNREFYTRLLQGPDGTPGEWLGDNLDSKYVYTPSGDGGFMRRLYKVFPDKPSVLVESADYRFDEATGTVARYKDGVAMQWLRVVRKVQDQKVDRYSVESLNSSVQAAPPGRAFGATYLLIGKLMTVIRAGTTENYKWSPPERPKAELATAERIAATPIERIARWGAYVALVRPEGYAMYQTGTHALNTRYISHLDWIVPGESLRSTVIDKNEGKRTIVGEMHWNEQTGQIDTYDRAGRVIAHGTVASDGSIRQVTDGSEDQLRALADGMVEDNWTLRNVGSGRSILFPNTEAAWAWAAATQRADFNRANQAQVDAQLARRAEESAKTDRFLNAMGGMQQALTQAEQDWDASRAATAPVPDLTASDASAPTTATLPAQPAAANQAPSNQEHLMGFPGSDCAVARRGAQRWVGSDGSFQVAHEIRQSDGSCLVQIDLDTVKHGRGTASSQ